MVSEEKQSILLLTTYLTKGGSDNVKPLSITEWNRLHTWMSERNILPEVLLEADLSALFQGFRDNKITVDRLNKLLDRKSALAISLDKWDKVGIWIVTILDKEYPERLKTQLNGAAPPVLFGVGPKALLNKKYVSIVGSRHVGEKDLEVAYKIGQSICNQGMGIISGGAKGVDEQAMLGCLEAEGNCVGILADSLLRRANSKIYRGFIQQKDLTLISPYNPEAGFSAGNAMGRNKYVYALSQAAIVVHSGEKGGTWAGATENIKKGFVPIWVYPTDDPAAANRLIVEKGGQWLPKDPANINLDDLTKVSGTANSGLFSSTNSQEKAASHVREPAGSLATTEEHTINEIKNEDRPKVDSMTLFDYFICKLAEHYSQQQMFTKEEVAQRFDLTPKQCEAWLARAVEDQYINKKTRPVRYFLNPFKKPPKENML